MIKHSPDISHAAPSLASAPRLTRTQQHLVEHIIGFCRDHIAGPPAVFVIEGDAGTGKSVVMNTAFARLQQLARAKTAADALHGSRNLFLVNHPEMIKFYKRVAEALPAVRKGDYQRPTSFVNSCRKHDRRMDVVFVDEAHLLLSRSDRYNHFEQDNHLQEILALAKVVVLVFDPHQVLKFKSYWNRQRLQDLLHGHVVKHVQLTEQFRMHAEADVSQWIHGFRAGRLLPLPAEQSFDFRISTTPKRCTRPSAPMIAPQA